MTDRYPPGPDKTLLDAARTLLRQQRDRLGFLIDMAQTYGDIVHFHTGLRHIYFINQPDAIHSVLVEHADKFHKTRPFKHAMEHFLGQGLLTIDGDFHRRERRLAQPAFHRKRIETYANAMVAHTQRVTNQWRDGQDYAIDREMMKITLGIVAETLFNAEVSSDAEIIGQAMVTLQEAVVRRFSSVLHPPDWLPTPRHREEQRAIQSLDRIIYRIIDERLASREDKGDLLSMLLLATDSDGSKMDLHQVRNEAISLFLAGHETTSNTLTWIEYLLTLHPDVMAKLADEVGRVLGGRAATLEDMERLPYTGMIVKEGLRLYPPVWLITREAITGVSIGGYELKPGHVVVICPYVMHRHPAYFAEPEQFQPERFADGSEKRWPHFAYFPFGGGPRVCLGQAFALMETTLILATLTQRFRLTLVPGQHIVPQPLISLRSRHGIVIHVTRRAPKADIFA
ncbi:MAG: cytochrome P450 [Anaerolineae bacterium]|nr:cytochrome P450 [Anaerolineae bacterium]